MRDAEDHDRARRLGDVFRALRARGEPHPRARRFTLQCAAARLAEDAGLLPRGLLAGRVEDCARRGGLLRPCDEGALFETGEPMHLERAELALLARAIGDDGSTLHPGVLGALFQATMVEGERHERGAHFTPEAAILEHLVRPSLGEPWRARIRAASTPEALRSLRDALGRVRVLDPACGSGDLLRVAHGELRRLERELLEQARRRFPSMDLGAAPAVGTRQLFGIDRDPFAVELTRVTLALGAGAGAERADLEANVRCDDALFCAWPAADLILGNPPFQSKNKMREELGADYVERLRRRYPGVPGRADHCVYWFRRAHDELRPGARAALVGTNTIRQNYSREGGLDHIVRSGGTITEAVSTMVWPGEAAVHVSVASWIKGEHPGPKRLSWQEGDARDSPWREVLLPRIPSSLSARLDVTGARALRANAASGACYQGQTHGHPGFLLSAAEARAMIASEPRNAEIIFPYLVGRALLTAPGGAPTRWIIDFRGRELREARGYRLPFRRVEARVLPDREAAAARERARNAGAGDRGNRHHEGFLRRWWLLGYARDDLFARLHGLGRYIACSRVTRRPIFAFVSTAVHPGDALAVFPLADDYSFGVLQSGAHAAWFHERCSTLKGDRRYTSNTVFDSFPWPQAPGAAEVAAVAGAAVALRAARRGLAPSLRAAYASMDAPGPHPLKDAQAALDDAVRAAYGMAAAEDPLAFLLAQNQACAAREAAGEPIVGPGLPPGTAASGLVTRDAVRAPRLGAPGR